MLTHLEFWNDEIARVVTVTGLITTIIQLSSANIGYITGDISSCLLVRYIEAFGVACTSARPLNTRCWCRFGEVLKASKWKLAGWLGRLKDQKPNDKFRLDGILGVVLFIILNEFQTGEVTYAIAVSVLMIIGQAIINPGFPCDLLSFSLTPQTLFISRYTIVWPFNIMLIMFPHGFYL